MTNKKIDTLPKWQDIFKAWELACNLKRIFLAFLWIIWTLTGIQVFTWIISKITINYLNIYFAGFFKSVFKIFSYQSINIWQHKELLEFLSNTLKNNPEIFYTYIIICSVWIYIGWCLFGGSLHRDAGIDCVENKSFSIMELFNFVSKNFWVFFFAPFLPLFIGAIGIIINIFLGYLTNILEKHIGIPAGVSVAVLFIPIFIISILALISFIATFLSPSLSFCGIAIDELDQYDAVSHCVSFICYKTWRYIFYHIVALIYGLITAIFSVSVCTFIGFIMIKTFSIGLGRPIDLLNPSGINGSWIMSFMAFVYSGMILGFVISYYVTLKTHIYILLRYDMFEIPSNNYFKEKK